MQINVCLYLNHSTLKKKNHNQLLCFLFFKTLKSADQTQVSNSNRSVHCSWVLAERVALPNTYIRHRTYFLESLCNISIRNINALLAKALFPVMLWLWDLLLFHIWSTEDVRAILCKALARSQMRPNPRWKCWVRIRHLWTGHKQDGWNGCLHQWCWAVFTAK